MEYVVYIGTLIAIYATLTISLFPMPTACLANRAERGST